MAEGGVAGVGTHPAPSATVAEPPAASDHAEIAMLRAKLQDAYDELELVDAQRSQIRQQLATCEQRLEAMDRARADIAQELESAQFAHRRCTAALEEERFITKDLRREVSTLASKLSQLVEERVVLIDRAAVRGESAPPALDWDPDATIEQSKRISENGEEMTDLSTFLSDDGLNGFGKLDASLLSGKSTTETSTWRTMLSQARATVVAYASGVPRNEAEFRQLLLSLSEVPPTRHAVRGPVSSNVDRLRQAVACTGDMKSMPESARGSLWAESIGNRLQVTEKQFERICRKRDRLRSAWEEIYRDGKEANQGMRPRSDTAKTIFSQASSDLVQGFEEEELYLIGASLEQIPLDVNRTLSARELATLGDVGPSSEKIRDLLEAFAVFKPEFGYTQGMNFVAAILLVYLDACRAFVCFSNAVLLQPWLAACYTFNMPVVHRYFEVFDDLLVSYIPKVGRHFQAIGLNADIFLVEWWFTLFAKSLPLQVTVRLWDMFFLEGDFLLYRASLAILQCFADFLLARPRDECLALLSSWPALRLEPPIFFETMDRLGLTEKRLATSFERAPTRSSAA